MSLKRVKAIDFKAGKPVRWQAYDTYDFEVARDASKRRMTPEGFMIVPANISRTGIQEYTARELGIDGTNRTIRLYRPPEEVFKPESYGTFERQTLTNNHPEGDVNAKNYRAVTSGDVHDVAPVGDDVHLGANLYFKDDSTIEYVVTWEKNQLSCGYSFVLDMTPGVAPDGTAYDGVMRDIVGNHVALVWQARGGPGLRVADNDNNNRRTHMHPIIINGIKVMVADETAASTIEREVKALTDARDAAVKATAEVQAKLDAAETALKSAKDSATEAKTAHDAKVKDLEAKIVTGDALHVLAEELAAVSAEARAIVGDDADFKGKTVTQIRLAALEHAIANDEAAKALVGKMLKGIELAKASADVVGYAFDAIVAKTAGGERSTTTTDSAEAFVPVKRVGDRAGGKGGGKREWTGEDIFAYRQTHGGKNPPGYGTSA